MFRVLGSRRILVRGAGLRGPARADEPGTNLRVTVLSCALLSTLMHRFVPSFPFATPPRAGAEQTRNELPEGCTKHRSEVSECLGGRTKIRHERKRGERTEKVLRRVLCADQEGRRI